MITSVPTIKTEHLGGKSYTALKIPCGGSNKSRIGPILSGSSDVPTGFLRVFEPSESDGCALIGTLLHKDEPLIDDQPYISEHPRSVSLECRRDDNVKKDGLIEFSAPYRIRLCLEAIRIAYGLEAPLPDPFSYGNLVVLKQMFTDHFIDVVVPLWERAICRQGLALNVRDPSSSSISSLLRLLNIIWQSPYGWFPVAKRVVIGIMADMIHLNTRTSVFQFVQDSVLPCFPDSGIKAVHVPSILTSLITIRHPFQSRIIHSKHSTNLRMVMRVHKCAAGGFLLGDGDDDFEVWNDAKSGDVNVEIPNEGRRSCAIS